MLNQDADETLNGSEAYAVNHNWTLLGTILSRVLQVKPLRHLEIQLNGTALPCPAQGIPQVEVNLRTIERAVALVYNIIKAHVLQRLPQAVCSHLPILVRTHGILGPGGQLHKILKAKLCIHFINQFCYALNLILNLVVPHKDMGIILGKTAHAHQTVELSAFLMAVNQSQLAYL